MQLLINILRRGREGTARGLGRQRHHFPRRLRRTSFPFEPRTTKTPFSLAACGPLRPLTNAITNIPMICL